MSRRLDPFAAAEKMLPEKEHKRRNMNDFLISCSAISINHVVKPMLRELQFSFFGYLCNVAIKLNLYFIPLCPTLCFIQQLFQSVQRVDDGLEC